jgi:hypothetical protein
VEDQVETVVRATHQLGAAFLHEQVRCLLFHSGWNVHFERLDKVVLLLRSLLFPLQGRDVVRQLLIVVAVVERHQNDVLTVHVVPSLLETRVAKRGSNTWQASAQPSSYGAVLAPSGSDAAGTLSLLPGHFAVDFLVQQPPRDQSATAGARRMVQRSVAKRASSRSGVIQSPARNPAGANPGTTLWSIMAA